MITATSARPVRSALGIFALFMVVTVGAAAALTALLPDATGEARAFATLVLLVVLVLAVAPRFARWSELGVNGPRHWRRLGLLTVPAALSVTPLLLGVHHTGSSRLVFLTVGYLMTGIAEELLWRGIVQRTLAPLGTARAVLLTSALFGAAHLANLAFRDNPGLVLAQAWGAFCFGVGYGAVRTRIDTIVPLIGLHLVTDLAAAVGAMPKIPTLVAQDVVLLAFGIALLVRTGRAGRPHSTALTDPAADPFEDPLEDPGTAAATDQASALSPRQ